MAVYVEIKWTGTIKIQNPNPDREELNTIMDQSISFITNNYEVINEDINWEVIDSD